MGSEWSDLRDHLKTRCAGSDHGNPIAGQVGRVVPPGSVDQFAGKCLDALDIGILRLVERTDCADQKASSDDTLARVDAPYAVRLVEDSLLDIGPEPKVFPYPVLVGTVLGIGAQLVTGCKQAG